MRLTTRRFWLPIVIASAAGLLTGCGGSSGGAAANQHPSQAILGGVTASLEGNSAEWASDAAMANASELATQQCMQKRGLVYYTTLVTPSSEAGSAWFPFPDQTLAYARHSGYGLYSLAVQDANAHTTNAKGGQGAASTDREELYELSLRGVAKTTYVKALVGRTYAEFRLVGTDEGLRYPTTGCTAFGEKKVYGTIAGYFDVTDQLVGLGNILASHAMDSGAYKQAIGRWRTCMAAGGFHDASPDSARAALANMPGKEQVSSSFQRREIRTAVHDIGCQLKVGLRQAYGHALADAVPALGSKLSATVLEMLSARQHAVQAANELLSAK